MAKDIKNGINNVTIENEITEKTRWLVILNPDEVFNNEEGTQVEADLLYTYGIIVSRRELNLLVVLCLVQNLNPAIHTFNIFQTGPSVRCHLSDLNYWTEFKAQIPSYSAYKSSYLDHP